ncbi:hypothetical protein Tco_1222350, partial [Tanacetum coccineum]
MIKLAIGLNVFQQDPFPHGRILLLVSLLNSFYLEGLQNSVTTSLCSNNIKEGLFLKHGLVSKIYSKKSLIMASIFGSKSKYFMIMSIPPQDEPSINRPMMSEYIGVQHALNKSILKGKIPSKPFVENASPVSDEASVENADLKAHIQEKVFSNAALKNELRKLKGNSVDTKFSKPSILGKPALQPLRNQLVARQPNAFKSEQPKPRFASQVDVKHDLTKQVTPHYLPKVQEYVLAKPHHMIAPSSSRNSKKESYCSNDMAHNHYLEEVRKKTQERNRNSKPGVMHATSLKNTTNGSKQKPKSKNQTSRSLHVSKSRHRLSPNKFSTGHEKTNTPTSSHRWKPTSRIFNTVGPRENGRMILESVKNGPFIWPTIEENRVTRTKKYAELSATEKIQVDCDMKATNIILQGLPANIYSLVNHHRVAKDLWERVQLLM